MAGHGRERQFGMWTTLLKGSARPDIDVDLLVEFDASARPNLLDLAQIEIELSELLGGRRVDLRTAAELSRHFRDNVVAEAQVQYVAG